MSGAETSFVGLRFLRPEWLWCLLPLGLAAMAWWRGRHARAVSVWDAVVDPALRPYVLEAGEPASNLPGAMMFAGWALALLVLSGPVFERREVPVYDARGAEVLLVDLSRSMLTDDLRPDRLTRARYKITDLLERERGVAHALVVFAERPYVVSPLTEDSGTLRAFLPSLSPDIVPVQGSRIDLAIDKGVDLLERAGVVGGRLVLVTDGEPDAAATDAAARAKALGHALMVLGVGTRNGAPLRDGDGRFLKDREGDIVVPRLRIDALDALARAGGGVAVGITADDSDLEAISAPDDLVAGLATGEADRAVDGGGLGAPPEVLGGDDPPVSDARTELWWVERGPWAVPLLALAALGLFRRGATRT